MTAWTLARIASVTWGSPLTTRETVFCETPARRATSVIDTRGVAPMCSSLAEPCRTADYVVNAAERTTP
jgi:hypothetical protein